MAAASKFPARFGPGLAGFVLVPLLSLTPGIQNALAPLNVLTARITAALIRLSGMPVLRDAAVLSHPLGFSCEIDFKCSGLILALFLGSALLMLPGHRGPKSLNILLGAAMVFSLNFLRLVSLFYFGVRYPQAFDFFHDIFWEILMLWSALAFWLFSLRRAPVIFYCKKNKGVSK